MSLSALQNSAMMAADQAQSRARLRAASTSTVDAAKLKQACQQMESIFVGMLWKEMRKTLSNDSMLYGGIGEDIFTSQLDQAYSDLATKQRSMGLADMLYQQMKPQSAPRPSGNLAGGYKPSGAAAADLAIPLAEARVTSTFGTRVHPVTGEVKQHDGLDLAAPEGTPVAAAAEGKVVFAGEEGGYGNLVIIEHADGRRTCYGHLAEIMVQENQKVTSGQQVATVGSTGISTGPHLHFEVRDKSGAAVDPWPAVAGSLGSKV